MPMKTIKNLNHKEAKSFTERIMITNKKWVEKSRKNIFFKLIEHRWKLEI